MELIIIGVLVLIFVGWVAFLKMQVSNLEGQVAALESSKGIKRARSAGSTDGPASPPAKPGIQTYTIED